MVLHIFWCAPEVSFGGGAGKLGFAELACPFPAEKRGEHQFL